MSKSRTAVAAPESYSYSYSCGILAIAALLIGCFAAPLHAEETESPEKGETKAQPTADPAPSEAPLGEDIEASIAKAFDELADTDADVRDAARTKLMGIERRYLPALQKLVEHKRPLLPSQAAVLRQIVTHVYLAGEPYDANGNFGFLGVKMLPIEVNRADFLELRGVPAGEPDTPLELELRAAGRIGAPQLGVLITERLNGFVGNRLLLEGDVILGIADRGIPPFPSTAAFGEAVMSARAGRTLRFHVLRRGRLMKIAISLDPRPLAVEPYNPGPMNELETRRRIKAENYWRQSFGRLLKEQVG